MTHFDLEPLPDGKVTWRCSHCESAGTRDDHVTAVSEARRHVHRWHRDAAIAANVDRIMVADREVNADLMRDAVEKMRRTAVVVPVNGNGAKP